MKFLFSTVLFTLLGCKKPAQTTMTVNTFKPVTVKYLALGDSYTIGQSVDEADNFPSQLISKLNHSDSIDITSTQIIAKTGWTTQKLLNAMASENLTDTFGLVSLLIGVNNQYQGKDTGEYAVQFESLLNKAISLAGGINKDVVVIAIPDYGYTPFGQSNQQSISKEIDLFNSINQRIANRYQITYFNITPISRNYDTDLVANDGLHPSAKQYGLWVDLMYNQIKKQLLIQ
ncbi:MAG: SGNH/GDSL hydrolase family protein [Bacteroidota bacterium]